MENCLKLTDNIRILSEFQINKLCQTYNTNICNGTHETDIYGESIICLGDNNKDETQTSNTISHESIHEILTHLFNESVSFCFDRLFYNQDSLTNGEFKGLNCRESLITFFTIGDQILI
jgi:hypothetical protein